MIELLSAVVIALLISLFITVLMIHNTNQRLMVSMQREQATLEALEKSIEINRRLWGDVTKKGL